MSSPKLSVCIEALFTDLPLLERIEAVSEAGGDGIEFWDHDDKDLDAISAACADAGVEFVGMVGDAGNMTDPERTEEAIAELSATIERAQRHDCSNLIITVGAALPAYTRSTQHDAIVDVLSGVADVAEEAGVTLVLEPLNTHVDHPEYYLSDTAEGLEILDAVESPNVTLLFDIYHQQITEGNVTELLTENIESVGHVHFADVPGRHEPGTGELNYANIFDALAETGYDGFVGAEFFPQADSEQALAAVPDVR